MASCPCNLTEDPAPQYRLVTCRISMQYRVSIECNNARCACLFISLLKNLAEHRVVDSAGGLPSHLLVQCSIPIGPTALHLYSSHHNATIPRSVHTCSKALLKLRYSFDCFTFALSVFFAFHLRFDGVLRADYSHSMWVAVAGSNPATPTIESTTY
jgi:hypothetical protein